MEKNILTAFFLLLLSQSAKPFDIQTFQNFRDVDTSSLAIANLYFDQGKYEESAAYYVKSLIKLENNSLYKEYINALNRLAHLNIVYLNHMDQAKRYLDSALWKIQHDVIHNDTLIALTWYTLGVFYDYSGQPDTSLYYHQKALALRYATLDSTDINVAKSLASIGDVYRYTYYDYFSAEKYYEESLFIRERLNKEDLSLGSNYYNLSSVSRNKGDCDKALSYAFRALQCYLSVNKTDYYNISATYSLIANIYHQMEDVSRAVTYNQKAIDLVKENHISESLPYYYNNQAEFYLALNNGDSAISFCQKAIAHSKKIETIASSYHILGNAYRLKRDFSEALNQYKVSLELSKKLYQLKHWKIAQLFLNIGRAYEAKHQFRSALHEYQKALIASIANFTDEDIFKNPVIRENEDIYTIAEILSVKAGALKKLYDENKKKEYLLNAFQCYKLFDHVLDMSRNTFSREGSKLLLAKNYKPSYEDAIDCVYLLHQSEQADSLYSYLYYFMEKNKALILFEALQKAEQNNSAIPDSLYLLEKSLNAKLAYYNSGYNKIKNQSADLKNIDEIKTWQLKMFAVERELQKMTQELKFKFPNYYKTVYETHFYKIEDVQNHLIPDLALIEYFYGDHYLYILCITNNKIYFQKKEKDFALEEQLNRYLQCLNQDFNYKTVRKDFNSFISTASYLHDELLEPFLKIISVDKLVIIPDGLLTLIPYESLLTSPWNHHDVNYKFLPYLIRNYRISYSFSGNIFMNEIKTGRKDIEQPHFIAFSLEDGGTNKSSFQSLPNTSVEVFRIGERFSKKSIFYGKEATKANFKKYASQADILHIATHGLADPENPYLSNFTFKSTSSNDNDGILYQYEIFSIPIKAKLTFLSACESGIGKYYAGEGSYSLARSLMYAGSASIVMTMWKIDDYTTSMLAQSFYKNLEKHEEVSEALRLAKLNFLENADELTAHPKRWAGILLVGNPNVKFQYQEDFNYGYIVLFAIVSLCCILIFNRFKLSR